MSITVPCRPHPLLWPSPYSSRPHLREPAWAVRAPLPGTVVAVAVTNGQAVKKGDTVVVLEAMKMENNIAAECDGTVTAVCVNKGDAVQTGAVLLTIG